MGSVSKVNLYVNLENVVIELVQGHEGGRSKDSWRNELFRTQGIYNL